MNKGHWTCGLILNIFGRMRSEIGQMHAHFTKCVRIWPLLVSLTKCAAHLGKCTIGQMHTHLTKLCAFGQMPRVVSISEMHTAQRICPNAQIGQMHLTMIHAKISHCYMNVWCLKCHQTVICRSNNSNSSTCSQFILSFVVNDSSRLLFLAKWRPRGFPFPFNTLVGACH